MIRWSIRLAARPGLPHNACPQCAKTRTFMRKNGKGYAHEIKKLRKRGKPLIRKGNKSLPKQGPTECLIIRKYNKYKG